MERMDTTSSTTRPAILATCRSHRRAMQVISGAAPAATGGHCRRDLRLRTELLPAGFLWAHSVSIFNSPTRTHIKCSRICWTGAPTTVDAPNEWTFSTPTTTCWIAETFPVLWADNTWYGI